MATRISRPARFYGALARAEMVTWAVLLLGMVLKYAAGQDWATSAGGGIHGFVFLCYCVATVVVAVDHRWSARDLALGLGSSVIPFCTLPFERSAERHGLLDGDWRLRDGAAQGPVEGAVKWGLANAAQAALAALVLVVVVFALLLVAGPPTQWF